MSRETSSGGEDQISGNGMLGSYSDHESWSERYIGVGIPSPLSANTDSKHTGFHLGWWGFGNPWSSLNAWTAVWGSEGSSLSKDPV